MSIYVDKRGGSLIIDRRIAGRDFKRATGLPDTPKGRHTAGLWDGMIDTLLEGGRAELVWALGRALAFQDVWPHFRTGAWSRIPSPEHMAPLFPSVRAWLPTARKANGAPISEVHRRTMACSVKALEKLRPRATKADAPDVLREYRGVCEKLEIGRTFRKAKNTLQSYFRETQGKRRSHLWAEVSDIPDVAYERDVTAAVTVARALEIRAKLSPPHAAIWWEMCCSGAMPDEIWGGKCSITRPEGAGMEGAGPQGASKGAGMEGAGKGAGIRIGGTKTAYRNRVVPLIVAPTPPARQYKAFRLALQKVDPALTPYVARRSYGYWLEEAGINPTRRRLYMGHRAKDPHELYPEHDVTPHLAGDAQLLTGYIGFEVGT